MNRLKGKVALVTGASKGIGASIAQPDDIARVAVFYASDGAGWVTGQTLVLAGGQRQ